MTDAVIERIGEHYGVPLAKFTINVMPPFYELTCVLVAEDEPRADYVDQVNATGGETQGLVRRTSRRFSCTMSASGQFLHVPARLSSEITSFDDLKARTDLTICSGNLSTQTIRSYLPDHTVNTQRVDDIEACDILIVAGEADTYVNPMPTLDVATAAGLVLLNTYTAVDTGIVAGTPLWVAMEGVSCEGSYNDLTADLCTME